MCGPGHTQKAEHCRRTFLNSVAALFSLYRGPVFAVFERQQIPMLGSTGIIYEYHKSLEVLYARPLSLIRADGTIRSELL